MDYGVLPIRRVGITGSTSGIGKALAGYFHENEYGVTEFSRTNGYDLDADGTIPRIVEISDGLDIFINNSYSGFRQVELLYALWDKWKDRDRMIINISSNSGDGIKRKVHPYAIHKASLDKACEQLAYQDFPCKVVNLRPGWVNTPRVKMMVNESKLHVQDIVTIVDFVIKNKDVIHFHEMTFRAW